MRHANRRDANERQIIDALEAVGASVFQITDGNGKPDLAVGFRGIDLHMEVKDGNKAPSDRRLTPDQSRLFARWKGRKIEVVESIEQALAILQLL